MKEEVFVQTLREFKYHEPFQPFVIELRGGGQIEIDDPDALGFTGGEGGFLNSNLDLVEFSCEEVRTIRAAAGERAS